MKVWIDNCDVPPEQLGGKSLFCKRLADQFRARGVQVTQDIDAKCDASINVIRMKHKKSKVRILRIDGVWHDTAKNWKKKNKAIQASVRQADGVVYQSEFARRMGEKFLGPANKEIVIFNGSDPSLFRKIEPLDLGCKHPFITFSKWRPHKRLEDTILSFLKVPLDDKKLFIAGDVKRAGISDQNLRKYCGMKQLEFVGNLPHSELMPIVKGCVASVHLCWFDACPNSVVETLCAGVPVITNNTGGTWEIVAPAGGYVCAIDAPYDYRAVDLYHPPEIDRRLVSQAMVACAKDRPRVENAHVDIRHVAEQYLNFITRLLWS